MTKFMPPKPEFDIEIRHGYEIGLLGQEKSIHELKPFRAIAEKAFNEWYAKEIASLFERAIEVYGHETKWNHGPNDNWVWQKMSGSSDTHRALLIRLEPIADESADDLLRELYRPFDDNAKPITATEALKRETLITRIGAYLEKKNMGK